MRGQLLDGRSFRLFKLIDFFKRADLAMDIVLSLPAERPPALRPVWHATAQGNI